MKQTVAVIGSGIAGLAAAYLLRNEFSVTLYEKSDKAGGHSNTLTIDDDPGVAFDTGFMVFNHKTYPILTRLFRELEVDTYPTSMSFSVQHIPEGLEYCGSGWNGLFGQRRNIANPAHWKLLSQINRFNTESRKILTGDNGSLTVKEYCRELNVSDAFLEKYLIPMSGAVWSTPAELMLEFPALSLVRFFDNHGFLGMNTQHQWYTVKDGSRTYVKKIIDIARPEVRLHSTVKDVRRENSKVRITDQTNEEKEYDFAIVAAHADQAYEMVSDLRGDEKKLLKHFKYQKNIATIHTDERIMPARKRIWSSWNYRIGALDGKQNSTIYWMNNLQRLKTTRNYFVSIDDKESISKGNIIKEIEYEHPLFSVDAVKAQYSLDKLNRDGLFFCGSYHRYGFHEDALLSALRVAECITGKKWN